MLTFSFACAVPFLFGVILREGNAFIFQQNNAAGKLKTTATTTSSSTSRREFFTQVVSNVSFASLAFVFSPTETLAIDANVGGKIQFGDEGIMSPKEHGTSANPVQSDLLYGTNNKLADKISNFNRHFAENGGYFQSTSFENTVLQAKDPITFYDSVTGKALFVAPINRSAKEFIAESKVHGWPSFRDEEVVWDNVRVLKRSGETVSVDGTHLGHNLPDRSGNRYCINLVSIAGKPITQS